MPARFKALRHALVWVAKSWSSDNRDLKQTPAVLLPSVVLKRGGSGGGCAGALRWRETRERAMNAMDVVVIPECLQLSRQVDRVPEEGAVQVFAPNRADQTLDGCETGA
jgi:hypothetical protein